MRPPLSTAQGLLGTVVLSGQDADVAALQRVALGTQAVSVWKDARALGRAAGEAAVQLAGGASLADVEGTAEFVYTNKESGAETNLASILLTPVPITQENLDQVVDAEWITAEELCSTGGTVGPALPDQSAEAKSMMHLRPRSSGGAMLVL